MRFEIYWSTSQWYFIKWHEDSKVAIVRKTTEGLFRWEDLNG